MVWRSGSRWKIDPYGIVFVVFVKIFGKDYGSWSFAFPVSA